MRLNAAISFAHPVCNASFSFQYDYLDGSSFMETSLADNDYLGGLPPLATCKTPSIHYLRQR
jgi:hypothetical protein